jgi:hypothetical protein
MVFDEMDIELEGLDLSDDEEPIGENNNFKNASRRMSKDEVLGFDESSVVASPIQVNHVFFEKIFEIMENEWFSRLWTYQEYCLAVRPRPGDQRSLEFLLEDLAVPWDIFMDVHRVAINPYHHQPMGRQSTPSQDFWELGSSECIRLSVTRTSKRTCQCLNKAWMHYCGNI